MDQRTTTFLADAIKMGIAFILGLLTTYQLVSVKINSLELTQATLRTQIEGMAGNRFTDRDGEVMEQLLRREMEAIRGGLIANDRTVARDIGEIYRRLGVIERGEGGNGYDLDGIPPVFHDNTLPTARP